MSINKIRSRYLELFIFLLKNQMVYIGKLKGLSHPDTVKCSQRLDYILNRYQYVKK
nr:aspartyl-phosphate phosphatase Spo0E family protein [Aquibacillus saliphilus]